MPRYGGGSEDARRDAEELRAQRAARESLIGTEQALQKELKETLGLETEAQRTGHVGQKAREESADLAKREERTAGSGARAKKLDTDAIERQTIARQRLAQAQLDLNRAFAGARDPLFARAAQVPALAGDVPSRNAILRQLRGEGESIGSGRASRIQEALRAGIQPSGGLAVPAGPLTRVQAAEVGQVRAQQAFTAATTARVAAVKAGTDIEISEALAKQEAANAARKDARLELESAKAEAAARGENAAAAQREAAMRNRMASEAQFVAPGQRQIPSRTGYTGVESSPAFARVVPPVKEAPLRYGGGSAAYDAKFLGEQQAVATAQAEAQARAQKELIGFDERAATVTQQYAQRQQQLAASFVPLNSAMHRHGALSAEFIQATARGEVTLRQLGQQAIVTAGKFGGWTAAAVALFGAAAAIQRVGHGAIEASSGVHTLTRVINDVNGGKAQQDFSNLSRRFNVPIETTVDAVYRMGQVFHNQADATKAAEAALFSFKTGEVDVASSTQNLIAIVNGFGLSAGQLVDVYDQINQAQNVFGIRIGDTEQGLAKAGGVYRAAGGDLSTLLALFVAIQKATGRSGTEIGTGIARGVNQIRQAANQRRLADQGVTADPSNFQETVNRAFVAARKGADVVELARGLLGNQYARLIIPVLANQTRFNEALAKTSPEAAKGSAQRELGRVLKQTDEQIKALGNDLERMGAALARAGAFTPLGALLKVLHTALDDTAKLIELFDKLPSPLRHGLALLVEMGLALKVLRRFGAFDSFANTPGLGFIAKPDDRRKVYGQTTLRTSIDATGVRAGALAQAALQQHGEAAIAARRASELDKEILAGVAAGTLGEEELAAKNAQRLAYVKRNEALVALSNATMAEANTAAGYGLALQEKKTELDKLSGVAYTKRAVAEGMVFPRNLAPVNFEGTVKAPNYGKAGGPAQQLPLFTVPTAAAAGGAFAAAGAQAHDAGLNLTSAETGVKVLTDRTGRLERRAGQLGDSMGRLGISGAALGRGLTASAGAVEGAGTAGVAAAGAGIRKLGGGLLRFAAALGPLDYALIGAGVYFGLIKPALDRANAKADQAEKTLHAAPPTSLAEYQKRIADLNAASHLHATMLQRFDAAVKDEFQFVGDIAHDSGVLLGGITKGFEAIAKIALPAIPHAPGLPGGGKGGGGGFKVTDILHPASAIFKPFDAAKNQLGKQLEDRLGIKVPSVPSLTSIPGDLFSKTFGDDNKATKRYKNIREKEHEALKKLAAKRDLTLKDLADSEARVHAGEDPNAGSRYGGSNRFADEISEQLSRAAKSTGLGLKDYYHTLDRIDDAILHSPFITPEQQTNLRGKVKDARRARHLRDDPSKVFQDIGTATDADLQKYVEYFSGAIASPGHRNKPIELKGLRAAFRRQLESAGSPANASALADLQKAVDAFYGGLGAGVEREVQEGLMFAHSEGDRKKVFARARRQLRAGLGATRKLLKDAKDNRDLQQGTVDTFNQRLASGEGYWTQTPEGRKHYVSIAEIRAKMAATLDALGASKDQVKAALAAFNEGQRKTALALGQISQEEYDSASEGRRIALALRQSRTADPGTKAQEEIGSARADLRDIKKRPHLPNRSRKIQEAQTRINEAGQTLEQTALDTIRAHNELAQALASADPARVAALTAQGEAKVLAYMRAHRGSYGGADIIRQRAATVQAQINAANEARQNAIDVAQLQGELRSARAGDDPRAQAQAAKQAAQIELRYARTNKERLQALVDLARADNQIRDAVRQHLETVYALKESRTQDPLKIDKLELQKFRRELPGTKGDERKQIQTEINNNKRKYKQDKVQSKDDDIEFALAMDKITADAAAQQILHLARSKAITKQMRRQLLQRAHELQKGDDQDGLNIGNLKLPTIYDIRRLAARGTKDGSVVQNTNSYTFHVRDGSDIESIGNHLDRIHGSHVRSSQRSAGLRG